MKRTILERAKLAKKLAQKNNDPAWEQFQRDWTAFNAIYAAGRLLSNSETTAIDDAILKFFDNAAASRCLADIPSDSVKKLLQVPPGDDRYAPSDPKYRSKTRALAKIFDSGASAPEKLSALMQIVYQVRCNMIHGEKDPDFWRDKSLVRACAPITTVFVRHLTGIIGA
jgi:hypothetical protein